MANIAGDSILTRKFYGVDRPGQAANAVFTNGLLLRDDTLIKASTNANTAPAAIDTAVAGVKQTYKYLLRLPFNMTTSARLRAQIKWEVTTGGPPTTTGRVNLDVGRNGGASIAVAKFNGPTRATNALAAFTEKNMVVDIVASTTLSSGDTLDIIVEYEVVGAAAGATLVVQSHHDPATAGNELIIEIDV